MALAHSKLHGMTILPDQLLAQGLIMPFFRDIPPLSS